MDGLWNLDAVTLRSLYEHHEKELKTDLLAGKEWQEVQDKRRMVTELSIVLYYRSVSTNPAEHNIRQHPQE